MNYNMYRLVLIFLIGCLSVAGRAVTEEYIQDYHSLTLWEVFCVPWHYKAVESHKSFFHKTHANNGESYIEFSEGLVLDQPGKTWVYALSELPQILQGHRPTSDLVNTMFIDLNYISADANVPHDIRLVHAHKEYENWIDVAAASTFTNPEEIRKYFDQVFEVEQSTFEFLVGYQDKQPVACAVIFYEGEYASIYWVGVVPRSRRKGYGNAVTLKALQQVFQKKIRYVVLQAQPLGEKMYKKLGFIQVGYLVRF